MKKADILDMQFARLKIELAKQILDTEDTGIIETVRDLFKNKENDFWSELPEHVKKGIEKSKQQAKNGLLTPHDEVVRKYTKHL
ncbi:hypothetical protein [Pseudopedobacter sp.]|uniref:hypothetical protein n=1 Tax=Pseudopedobacter sp. TaxID=1936787 RepID=UPI0033409DBE